MEISAVPPQISNDEFVLEPIFVREDFGRPLEFVGHHLPEDLERPEDAMRQPHDSGHHLSPRRRRLGACRSAAMEVAPEACAEEGWARRSWLQ